MNIHNITLELDDDDYGSIINAIVIRDQMGDFPDGDSSHDGLAVAEICRGWLEMLGQRDPPLEEGLSVAKLVRGNTNEELSK